MESRGKESLAGQLEIKFGTSMPLPPAGRQEISLKPCDTRTLHLFYLPPSVTEVGYNNIMLLYHISRFYTDSDGRRLPDADLALALHGMLANMLSPNALLEFQSFQGAYELAGYDFEAIEITREILARLSEEDDRFQKVYRLLGSSAEIIKDRDLFFVLASVILLTIGKQVNSANYNVWFERRVAGFSGTLGHTQAKTILTTNLMPSLAAMSGVNSFLSASFDLRKCIFEVILAASTISHRAASGFRDICVLLRGTEMSHILMIDKMLYQKYPEIRALRSLNEDNAPMEAVWKYLSRLNSNEVMYCKLLHSKRETEVLKRTNFECYIAAAHAAASFDNPTLKQLVTTDQEKHNAIKTLVTQYLTLRLANGLYAIGGSESSKMCPAEKEKFIQDLESGSFAETTEEGTVQRN